ncbi:MAG TPA: ComEC/Rec2 family competence protein [Jatrophihabitans sp.]|nr:ComEC/Rec2 family competence protein [Jatrophihabitans sp.]
MSREQAPALDLRLVTPTLLGWLAVLWGLRQPAGQVFAAALLALLLTVAAAVRARRDHRWYGVAFATCTLLVVLLPLAARLHRSRDSPLARLARTGPELTAELTVRGDPRPLAAHGTSGAPRAAVDAQVHAVVVAGRRVPASGAVLVLGPAAAWRGVLPGQRVRLDGRLSPPLSDDLLTAVLSAHTEPVLLGRPPPWQRVAGRVRAGLQRASAGLPALPGGLLPGLIDGDTSRLDPVLANRFQVAGLTHLTAVSGANCAILIGAVAMLLRRFGASPRTTALIGLLVLAAFVVIARPSPSVLRAAVMATIALLALATGRQRSAVPALAATALALLVWQPSLAVNLGFALSVAATGALLLVAPGWVRALRARGVPPGIAEAVAIAAAAHLVTVPLIAGISGSISLVAIPANVLAEPVVGVATILGFLAALASLLWLPAAVAFAELAGWPCRWLVWVADYFGTLPGAAIPWPAGVGGGLLLAAVSGGLWWLARRPAARALLATAALVAVLVQIPVRAVVVGWPPPGWLLAACSVGQGDALALNAGGGSAVVVDAGPDPVPVDRCLRDLGIARVPLLVLTHAHLDHVGGLAGVLHQRQIGRVITSPLAEPVSGHRLVVDQLAARGLSLEQVGAGAALVVGPIRLDVLGPRRVYRGTRSDPNNSSVVLRATVAGERILLPGDAEVEAQDDLLDSGADLRADILKVPHHGSAYSDPRFLAAVHAKLAVITVGLHNDYGHPAPVLLAELAHLGVPVRRTDLDGDVAVVVRDGQPAAVVHAMALAAAARRPAGTGRRSHRLTVRPPDGDPRAPPRKAVGRP